MNIDLFMSKNGRFGLMCNGVFRETPAGILFDAETSDLTIEFLNEEPVHCNIQVDSELIDPIIACSSFYYGQLDNSQIAEALRLPLMVLNDPHKDDMMKNLTAADQTARVVREFDVFVKNSSFAQAVHRDDLSDESDSRSILNGTRASDLGFTPKLLRQKDLVIALGPSGPTAAPTIAPQAMPQMGGPSPGGPKGPGGVGGSRTSRPIRRMPPKKKDDDKGNKE